MLINAVTIEILLPSLTSGWQQLLFKINVSLRVFPKLQLRNISIILTSRCSSLLRSLNVSRWEKIIEIIILTIEIVYDIFPAIELDNLK